MKFNIIFIYLRFYIIISLIFYVTNFFAIPFETINLQYNETIKDYFSKLFSNDLYANIALGTPKQKVKFLLKMEQDQFYIYNNAYNHNKSSTFRIIEDDKSSYYFTEEKISEDIFYLKDYLNETIEKKLIPLNFILIKYEQKKDFSINWTTNDKRSPLLNNYGLIGLQYQITDSNNNIIFIKSLKESKAINNYIFSIFLTNENNFNNNGYILIGEEIIDDKIKFIKAEKRYGLIKWDIIFDEIYSNNYLNNENNENNKTIINKNHQVQLVIDKPYIIGTDNYESFIYNNFFHDLIDKGVCFKKYISINTIYYGYYCDNSSELFISKKFPELYFYSKELNEIFILNKKDLFYYDDNYNNKNEYFCYFMILFTKLKFSLEKQSWILGIPFFKKYRFYFDYDKKLIGFYNQTSFNIINNNPEIQLIDNNYNNIFKYIFISGLLLIIIFVLLGFLCKKISNIIKNQKKINILNDNNYKYKIHRNRKGNKNNIYKNDGLNIELVNKIYD